MIFSNQAAAQETDKDIARDKLKKAQEHLTKTKKVINDLKWHSGVGNGYWRLDHQNEEEYKDQTSINKLKEELKTKTTEPTTTP